MSVPEVDFMRSALRTLIEIVDLCAPLAFTGDADPGMTRCWPADVCAPFDELTGDAYIIACQEEMEQRDSQVAWILEQARAMELLP